MKPGFFITRLVIASLVTTSCLVAPLRSRTSIASAAPGPIKSESQYRGEASRYDAAVRAIGGIITTKIDTSEDLKAAVTIVERERPNLKFFRSKQVVLALGNSTFSSAVKRKMPTREAATTLITSFTADRNKVSTIGGIDDLRSQLKSSADADAAVLRRASEKLKTAAAKFKSAKILNRDSEHQFSKANFTSLEETSTYTPLPELTTILVIVYFAIVLIGVASYGAAVAGNASSEEGRDAVAECQERADNNYARCAANAGFFERVVCVTVLLAEQALCLASPDSVK